MDQNTNLATGQNPQLSRPHKSILISLIVFSLILLSIGLQVGYSLFFYDRIYKGVTIGNVPVGDMTRDEAAVALQKNYTEKSRDEVLTLTVEGFSERIPFNSLGLTYDVQNAVEAAYQYGRTGNPITRLEQIYAASGAPYLVELPVAYSTNTVEMPIQRLFNNIYRPVREAALLYSGEKISLLSGLSGKAIDRDAALAAVDERVRRAEGGALEFPVQKTPPAKINVQDLYNQLIKETKDAVINTDAKTFSIVPETVGATIDRKVLEDIAIDLEKTENLERLLPVNRVQPQLTSDIIKSRLFKDSLGTMSTQFYTDSQNNENRGVNIRLASAKLNGTILSPGAGFSFNDTVGPRTEDGGYKTAHAYSGGKVIDDVGGGICQVSTTLFNAAVKSGMEIDERNYHMFTVGYVPLGMDAAVSYDSVDLKFTNTSIWPVRIDSWVTDDNRLYFSLTGTQENPGRTVELRSEIVSTTNFSTTYIDDPGFPAGETYLISEGMQGYVVDTYRVIRQNGAVISNEKIFRSIYNPLSREVAKGTMVSQ